MVDQVKICEGISDISDSYGGFLIDQWGTLHNGTHVFDNVIATLENLKKRGKQIILISNSGKRADDNEARLKKLGIDKKLFDHVVTSAETTWRSLSERNQAQFQNLGEKYFLMNRLDDLSLTNDLDDLAMTDDIQEADFILLTGSDVPRKTMENYYEPLLKEASRRHMRMICANPEKTITIDNQDYTGSGEIARRYEECGGVVTYIGKPFPSIFQYALTLFHDLYPSQVCVIGDSLANDIRGAKYLDMDCALIANGVHKGSFAKVQNRSDIHKMFKVLGKNYGVEPTYFIPKFHWGRELPDRKNRRKNEK